MRYGAAISIIACVALTSCASVYAAVVNEYVRAEPSVQLGMNATQVAAILEPTQQGLANSERKRPERYMKDNVAVEIVYYRSGWNSDGITTDDEFTPYLFNDGKLVGIGWQVLGGPKSQGQAPANVRVTNTTIIY